MPGLGSNTVFVGEVELKGHMQQKHEMPISLESELVVPMSL